MLEIKNLEYGYDFETKIINGLNLTLKSNSYNCILGSNGSGKSTLCKLIANVIEADSGEILIDGKPIEANDVAIVFQNPMDQFVRPTVYDDLAFGLENLNMPVDQIHQKIDLFATKFNIRHLLDRAVDNLSGGEKQRIAIISNIMLNPKVLIMDEATDMLDPVTRIDLLNKLRAHASEQGMILIYITHDMDLAFSTDNIVIVNNGQVEITGTPLAIFNNQVVVDQNRLSVPYSVELMKKVCGEYCYTDLVTFKESYELNT